MIQIVRYAQQHKQQWDDFNAGAKNGVFLFCRDYMEYHADRYVDHSLLIFKDRELVALLPANAVEQKLMSHGGLTFGGIVSDLKMTTPLMLDIFNVLHDYLKHNGFQNVMYKAMPHIYHVVPAEEDLYALFRVDARLVRRDVSATISMGTKGNYRHGTHSNINKARKHRLSVEPSNDYNGFIEMMNEALQKKHNVCSVHTGAEMEQLASRFPNNIRLFVARDGGTMVAGTIIYEHRTVAHCQYMASNDAGVEMSALSVVLDFLISDHYRNKKYFDFGISNEDNGRLLNRGLADYKEGYGARAVVHDFYEFSV